MNRAQVAEFAELLTDAADSYDSHVFEKMRLRFDVGNNLVFEWDDVSEDDREILQPWWKPGMP